MTARESRPRAIAREELDAILARTQEGALSPEEHETLRAAVETLAVLTRELEAKGASLARLRRLLFGPRTETMRQILGDAAGRSTAPRPGEDATEPRPGHGRHGVAAYRAATTVPVAHASLGHGDRCPACARGKVYTQAEPTRLVRVTGMAPVQAAVYALQRLRCNACGGVFTAAAPPGVGEAKYDETAATMIALLKYGAGVPFYRLAKLEKSLGIPLPAATQWEVVANAATALQPAYAELIRQAAQGEVVYNDDTTMKILELMQPSPEGPPEAEPLEGAPERTGIFTSGIVATGDGQKVALFFTGRQHAGENLAQVLAQRTQELAPPIQMCDALSRNTTGEFATIAAHCLAHARRQFVDVAGSFPDECRSVLETLRDVYRNDALARERRLSPAERLAFHQEHSGPLLDGLEAWLRTQIEERTVEPHSGLGQAIAYMQRHWARLTLFLRTPGAPLDNTICERALKRVVLHRKNALFYKTEAGARVGDVFMSLIHTAELSHVDPFDYLVALQRHTRPLTQTPRDWMPWTYQATRAHITTGSDPPA